MNDFWEWMEQKGYGECNAPEGVFDIGKTWIADSADSFVEPTKQMLIGYMMEYLREQEGMIILNTGGRATINDVYERYVKDLEKLEQDNLLKRIAGQE